MGQTPIQRAGRALHARVAHPTAALFAMLLLAAIGPAPAAGSRLLLHDVGPIGPHVRSDGERYIAASGAAIGAPVTVLDTTTGKRSTVDSPAGCFFSDAHAGTLLWECEDRDAFETGVTLDLATGLRTALPAPPHDVATADGSRYEAIGARWARVRFFSYHATTVAWISRRTGRLVSDDPGASFVPDLDRAALMRPLCSPVERSTVTDASGLGVVLADDLAQAGPWAAGTSYADVEAPPGVVQLQHCGRAPRTLRICRHVQCSDPVITRDFVAWTENDRRGRLVVRSLVTGRVRTASRRAPLTPLLAGQRLYVAEAGRLLRVAL